MKTKIWYSVWFDEIKKVEIFKETEKYVYKINRGKEKKSSYFRSYFKTFSEAKLFLLNKKDIKLRDAERILKEAQEELQKVRNIMEKNVN